MELTDKQIQELYDFTQKHYVEHYDVQSELVDHLANDIERIWGKQPDLPFEIAKNISFKKFGVYGFMDVVEEKQKQLSKKYFSVILQYTKEWFTLPRMIFSLVVFYLLFTIQIFSQAYAIYTTIYLLIAIIEIRYIYLFKKRIQKKAIQTGKKWMFEDTLLTQGIGNVAFLFFSILNFVIPLDHDFTSINTLGRFIIALLLTLSCLTGYICLFVIPKNTQFILKKHYPEYQ
ncbi:conserved membrane protein of unknown function [Tenacibaculum sp. 190524A02b]|uniref:hypothetical protein n=1 Tax=Tenacibaculum vairaonense TaxID=3137860 RepID=UPI0032B2AF34